MVIFIGDKPSPKMRKGAAPFEGAVCEKRLNEWIKILGINRPMIINQHGLDNDVLFDIIWDKTIVALGKVASARIDKINKTRESKLNYFCLPHPSPRNRQLNDKQFIDLELEKCKNYLKRLS